MVTAAGEAGAWHPAVGAVPEVIGFLLHFRSSRFKGRDKKLAQKRDIPSASSGWVFRWCLCFLRLWIVGGTEIIFTHGNPLSLSHSSQPGSFGGRERHRLTVSYSSDVCACLWGILST